MEVVVGELRQLRMVEMNFVVGWFLEKSESLRAILEVAGPLQSVRG